MLLRNTLVVALFTMSQSSTEMPKASQLLGFRISKYSSFFPFSCSEDMLIPELSEGTEVTIRIVGHLDNVKEVALTASNRDCASVYPETLVSVEKESEEVGSITLTTPTNLPSQKTTVYYCFRGGEEHAWIHQGFGYWAKLIIVQRYKTVNLIIGGCILSIFFAAVLNSSLLSLMSLDMVALRAKAVTGTENEKIVCRALIGLRENGQLIIMAIIFCVIFFKTLLTVLLRMIFNGWLVIIVSTVIIVLIVEVIPLIWNHLEKRKKATEIHAESSVISKLNEEHTE